MDTSAAGMILILLLALFGILLFLSIEYKKNKDYRYLLSSVIVAEFMALFLACLIYAMFAHRKELYAGASSMGSSMYQRFRPGQ